MAGLFKSMLNNMLADAMRRGRLKVVWPNGKSTEYGDGTGKLVTLKIKDNATIRRMAINPALAVGEAYVEGTLIPDGAQIHDVLVMLLDNIKGHRVPVLHVNAKLRQWLMPILQANNPLRSRHNVAHHYDLNGRLYSLFLDRDRQYSCAYFKNGDETLEQAQLAKKRHIAAKLKLDQPNLEVLDIGCGWGGMAITLAKEFGARVTGITLSEEQLAEAQTRAAAAGLSERITFELIDYRKMDRKFDRIVSVGMFEHVGIPNYPAFFDVIRRCLKPDGAAIIHSIGRFAGASSTNPWIAKYIFPGGYSPALSEVMGPLEKSGLITTDIEILRLHYAKTIAHWRRRFTANRDAITTIYDERFCRMFEFYLSSAELAFRYMDHMNFQLQLVHNQEAVPLTRDYMFEQENNLAFANASD